MAPDYAQAVQVLTEEAAEAWLDGAEHLLRVVGLDMAKHTAAGLAAGLYDASDVRTALRRAVAYFAGYYGKETRRRVERIFKAVHPILGPVDCPEQFTTEELMLIGFQSMGRGALPPELEAKRDRIAKWKPS